MRLHKKISLYMVTILIAMSFNYTYNTNYGNTDNVFSHDYYVSNNTDADSFIGEETATNVNTDINNNKYDEENYTVDFTITNKWDSGYNATITIYNTGDKAIENWCIAFPLEQNISNIWNAVIKDTYDDYYVIKNSGWNQDIQVGESITFGITSYESFTEYPAYYTLIGYEKELKSGDYTLLYEITEDWGDGYKAQITITNNSQHTMEDWRLKFKYGDKITQIWDAVIIWNDQDYYEISGTSYNQNIESGASLPLDFLLSQDVLKHMLRISHLQCMEIQKSRTTMLL